MPPSPPLQTDWVILQRFAIGGRRARLAALRTPAEAAGRGAADPGRRATTCICCTNRSAGARPAPVSTVITTRVKPGQEAAFRAWEQRIAVAQARRRASWAIGSSRRSRACRTTGWPSCASIPSENLQAWLDSPERQALLREAEAVRRGVPTRARCAPGSSNGSPEPRPAARAQRLEAEHGRSAACSIPSSSCSVSTCRRRC